MKNCNVLMLLLFLFFIIALAKATNLKANKFLAMSEIAKGMLKVNTKLKQSNPKQLPSVNNRGFKCLRANLSKRSVGPISGIDEATLCGLQGESCVSKGVVIYKVDDIFDFIIQTTPSVIKCDIALFKIQSKNSDDGACYTHKVIESKYKLKELIPPNYFSNRVCKFHKDKVESEFTFFRQDDSIACDTSVQSILKKTFTLQTNPSQKAPDGDFTCYCYIIKIPNLVLINPYIPIRYSNSGFECLASNGADCFSTFDVDKCYSAIEEKIGCCIQKSPDSYLPYLYEYFFNKSKYICPSESGLNIAIRYEITQISNQFSYTISCLGRFGSDCFFDDNAESTCQRVNSCDEAKKEFKSLTCGSNSYKALWFHDGYNVPVGTWCKQANAWLNYDGKLTEIKDTAFIMNPSGNFECLTNPDNPAECINKNSKTIKYTDLVAQFNKDNSVFQQRIPCGKNELIFRSERSENICNFQIIHDNGKIQMPNFNKDYGIKVQSN